jgi:hypothetical protein
MTCRIHGNLGTAAYVSSRTHPLRNGGVFAQEPRTRSPHSQREPHYDCLMPNVKDEPRRELARRVQHYDLRSAASFRFHFSSTRRDRSRRWLWRLVGRYGEKKARGARADRDKRATNLGLHRLARRVNFASWERGDLEMRRRISSGKNVRLRGVSSADKPGTALTESGQDCCTRPPARLAGRPAGVACTRNSAGPIGPPRDHLCDFAPNRPHRNAPELLPNVKDEPRRELARCVQYNDLVFYVPLS